MINLVLFNKDKDLETLTRLLDEYRLETMKTHGSIEVQYFIDAHDYIYMVTNEKGETLGFVAYVVTNNFGLTDDTLLISYIHIKKKYRKGKAFYTILLNTGKLAFKHDCAFSFFTESEELFNMSKRLDAEESYRMFTCSREKCTAVYDDLVSKFKRK